MTGRWRNAVWPAVGLAAALGCGTLAGCKGDDPVAAVGWTLTVENNTGQPYDIYQDAAVDAAGFVLVSQVGAFASRDVPGLTVGVDYVFRLVPAGDGIAAYDYEAAYSSSGGNRIWAVP